MNSLNKKDIREDVILVLCIDRDDDVGNKGNVITPIIGRNSCIEAGVKLAINDPEDADSNVIFNGIKVFDELINKGQSSEIAIIAGKFNRGVEADEKMINELHQILSKINSRGVVIVTDGEDDETILPVIQSVLPIISVQRLVIRHSRSVEYSYALFGRYLKMLIYDPRYSKFFLGVPGALLIASGIATLFGLTREATAIAFGILGSAFIMRAFDLDKSVGSLGKPSPSSIIRIFSVFAGILIILASIINGLSSIPTGEISTSTLIDIITNRVIIGMFIHGTITLLLIGIGIIIMGSLLSNWMRGSANIVFDIFRLVVLALIYIPILQFTSILTEGTSPSFLISSLFMGLAIALIAVTFIFQYFKNKKEGEPLRH